MWPQCRCSVTITVLLECLRSGIDSPPAQHLLSLLSHTSPRHDTESAQPSEASVFPSLHGVEIPKTQTQQHVPKYLVERDPTEESK